MISRKTYCRALNLLQAQENLDAEARQILLTLLRDSIDDVCDYTSWWLSETDDFCGWTEDESQRWDLHNRKRFTISSPENTAERSISAAKIL